MSKAPRQAATKAPSGGSGDGLALRSSAARRLSAAVVLLLAAAGCDRGSPTTARAETTDAGGAPAARVVPVASQAPKPTGPVAADAGCMTAECHTTIQTVRFAHGVVKSGDCFVCHESDAGGHAYPLRRAGNDLCTHCHTGLGLQHQHLANQTAGCTGCHDPHGSNHRLMMTAATTTELCQGCHLADEHARPHGPYAAGECLACHEAHESEFAGLLRGGEGPEHCAMCHLATTKRIAEARNVHAPAAVGCTSCHDAHATDNAFSLRESIEQTCFNCHGDLEQTVRGATSPHGAVFTGAQCGNCHDPHASDRGMLLRDDQTELCLSCHDRPLEASDGRTIPNMEPLITGRSSPHGPVRSGNCVACHTIHGGTHSRLLRELFTPDFYTSFDLKSYALCFECHDRQLVTTERTTALTDFRNGDLNLHYLHVNRQQKGRTCRACHDIHGSNLPAHMAESVPFEGSDWALPIGFEQLADGGSCAPGCHQPETYSRTAAPDLKTGDPP